MQIDRDNPAPWLQIGSIREFEWNRVTLPIRDLSRNLDGLRIVHLTDLHFRAMWFPSYDRIIDGLRNDPPDLVLVTGDFVEARADQRPALPFLERFLKSLTSRLGIFGILGNHDGDLLGPRLGPMGVTLINGNYARLASDTDAVELVGVPGISRLDLDGEFLARIPPRRTGVPRIVLSHYPDAINDVAPLQGDVVLSGHTHGGQICLPNGFPPMTHDCLPRRMSKGIHKVGDSWLIVSRGLGFATWRVRAFCPAELIDITLRCGEGI